MTKRFGFTLAEVLITLGIIGVVAAMTMPTLMNQTNGAQYKAAYKKALSAISQAITLNVALDDKSFADATVAGAAGVNTTADSVAYLLSQRMNVVKVDKGFGYPSLTTANGVSDDTSNNTTLFFNDGSAFQFNPANAKSCTEDSAKEYGDTNHNNCSGFIDVNSIKGPNKIVTCDSGTSGDSCTVTSPTDIYPVVIYDQTVLPSTPAARAVLYGK